MASKYKSEFLANISHELRTPLNSLLILAQMLATNSDENLTPKQVEYLNTIHQSGVDLLKLINDILDLSKIKSGKAEIALVETTVGEINELIEKQFNPVAERKGVRFSVIVEDNNPGILCSDGQRLRQFLQNLLSNAFKFTDEGEVILSIKNMVQLVENTVEQDLDYLLAMSLQGY